MINERIKSARKMACLSLREAALKVGITAQAIHKYELGKTKTDVAILIKFSNAYGVPVDYFLRKLLPIEMEQIHFHK